MVAITTRARPVEVNHPEYAVFSTLAVSNICAGPTWGCITTTFFGKHFGVYDVLKASQVTVKRHGDPIPATIVIEVSSTQAGVG